MCQKVRLLRIWGSPIPHAGRTAIVFHRFSPLLKPSRLYSHSVLARSKQQPPPERAVRPHDADRAYTHLLKLMKKTLPVRKGG